MSEMHLIVLWEFARNLEDRILEDIRSRLEIVHTGVLRWPGDAVRNFGRFYGANLADANGKVRCCGGGAFRYVIVRDHEPRYAPVETSRGIESANATLFELKTRYREWTGGGHKVHTTNTVAEARRDIYLLTGHTTEEWGRETPHDLAVLPGNGGWRSLRELFGFLNQMMPYAVLRNAETLPDRFDPELHGDIDLIVPDAEACASLLGARKVFPEPYRVHYELTVGGRPVRFDFRQVGDGYYDERWQRHQLEHRVVRDGVYLLAPEDAFHSLVYHALYQKPEIAADYHDKALSLARAAGIGGNDYDDWLIALEEFLAENGYEKTRPADTSVYWNERTVNWRRLASEITRLSGATDLKPFRLEAIRAQTPLRTFFFSGSYSGKPCFVKYSPYAKSLTAAEVKYPELLARNGRGGLFVKTPYWHVTRDGGAFAISELIDGIPLDRLIADNAEELREKGDVIARDMADIALELKKAKICHRDIRPANLMVTKDGHVKLIDFQFAAPIGDSAEDPWIERFPAVLHGLGAEYALAPDKWNDRHSMRKCLMELPPTAAREEAVARLGDDLDTPDKVTATSPELMRWMKRRLARLRRKKLTKLLSRHQMRKFMAKYGQEMETLKHNISVWHTLPEGT